MHPWFRMPSLKRKNAYIYSDPDIDSPSYARTNSPPSVHEELLPAPKRRRCDVLERGLAQLSLGIAPLVSNTNNAFGHGPTNAFGGAYTQNATWSIPAEQPIVTEPEDVPIEDADSEWYEPEKDRIVITKLHDSPLSQSSPLPNTSSSSTNGTPDPVSVTISPALLDRLKSQHQNFGIPGLLQGPPPRQPDESRALVLFKPLSIPPSSDPEPVIQEPEDEEGKGVQEDTDMMDVEML